ncbi:hypothetical protein VMCG_09385 [Cytospora schulzeri]|uniref:Uncharacterized protein n=1 Tax=Cytospora schulzeri TaxID=448051 RepID=A0A423VIF5_9PEZI|nr:hypothetical protein VMCG_09385 [Valsa malicola]
MDMAPRYLEEGGLREWPRPAATSNTAPIPSDSRLRGSRSFGEGLASLDKPYLRYVEHLSKQWPRLAYLANFIRAGTAPKKAAGLPAQEILERQNKVKVAFLDFSDPDNIAQKTCENGADLASSLLAGQQQQQHSPGNGNRLNRVLIVEDLSSTVIELLGAALDIDPCFFRAHLEDHTWFNIKDDWVEMPELESQAHKRSFVTIKYMQPRFFENPALSRAAKEQAGRWNVLRRIDFQGQVKSGQNAWWEDSPHQVGLLRRKVSIWSRKEGNNWTGVILVDPCISEGNPLWNGYGSLEAPPKMSTFIPSIVRHPEMPLLESLLSCVSTLSSEDRARLVADPESITSHVYPMVFAEILVTLQYAFTALFQIEWQMDSGRSRKVEDLDTTFDKLQIWQRRLPCYAGWVRDAITGLEGRYDLWKQSTGVPSSSLATVQSGQPPLLQAHTTYSSTSSAWQAGLRRDFVSLLAQLQALQLRADKVMQMAVAILSVEEGKKAVVESRNMGRITYLAFVFVPLSFVTSFLGMNPDIASTSALVYCIFFAVAVPVSIVVLSVATYWNKITLWWESGKVVKKEWTKKLLVRGS